MIHAEADTVHRFLDYRSLVEALRVAHRDAPPPRVSVNVMEEPGGANAFVSLLAWAPQRAIAAKLVGVFPGNGTRTPPEPSVQGLVALFDAETGRALMTGDGAALTYRKTAADSALGADFLARRDARTLLVVGAGGLAPHIAEAHLAIRPSLERVLIWNRTAATAKTLVARLRNLPAIVEAVGDLDKATPRADIISSVTMAKSPLVKGALLKPGTHLDLVGAYAPDMREADDDVVRRAGAIFVDTRANSENSGEIAEPIARGLITREGILADFFDLAAGRHPGRTSDNQITMFKNVGGAHLDLFTAQYLLHRLARPTSNANR
jgi:ornithine cyclodeaminase